jgi:hypothetical protein
MAQIMPTLREQGKKIFGKKPAQIFAPLNADGELIYGYLFARSVTTSLTRKLTRIRGIGEMSTVVDDDGNFLHAVEVPHCDVLQMMGGHNPPTVVQGRVGNYVEILTGPAARYCGTITKVDGDGLIVQVNFPTGRCFLVRADVTSVKPLPLTPAPKRTFWGLLGS